MGVVRRVLEWPIGSRRREYGWYAFLSLLVGVYLALWSVWPEGDAPLGFELGVLAVGLIVLFECGVEATRVQRELFFKLLRMFDTYWLLASLVVFDVSSVWAMHATVPLLPLAVSICVMTATTCIFIFYDSGIAHGLPPLIATCMPALAAANIARGVFVRLAHLDDTYVPSTFCWIGARDNAPGSHCVDSDGLTQGSQLALFLFFAKAAALAGWSLRTKQPMICTTLSADLKCELGPLCFPPTRPKPAAGGASAGGGGTGGKGGREAVADAMLAEAATMLPGMGKLRYATRPRSAAAESAADASAPPPPPPPPPPLPPDVPGPSSPTSSAGTVNLGMKKKLPPLGGGGGGMLGAAALPSKAPASLAPVSGRGAAAAVPRSGRGRGGAVQLGSSTPTAVSISAGVAVAPVPSPSHRAPEEEKTAAVTSPTAAMKHALQPQMQPAQAPAAHVSIAVHPVVCSITVAALSPSPPSSPISPSPTARLLPASSAASTRAMADAMSAASPSSTTAASSSPTNDATSPTSAAAAASPPKPANNAARPQSGAVARERERVQYLMLDPVPNKLYINPAPKLQVIFRSLFPKWRIVASVRALVWAHAKSFYALLVAGMLATIASLDEGAWGWGFSPSARGVAVAINAVVMLFWLSIELTRADKRLLLRLCQNFTYWYLLALGLLYCGLGLYSYVFIGPGQAGYSEADTDWSYSGVTFVWLWVWWLWAVSLDSLVGLSPRLKQLLLLAIVANNLRLLVRQLFLADGFPNESLCLFQCSETRAFGVNSLVTITAFLMRSLLRAWRHPERLTLISMSVDHSMLRHRLAAKDRPAEAAAASAYVLDGETAPALARGGGGGSRVAPHPGHGSSAQPQRAPNLQQRQQQSQPPTQQQPQQARPAHNPAAPPSPSGPQPAVAAAEAHERKGHRSQRTTSRRRERESARPPSAAQRAAAQPTA
jgi:hypothetical protein